MKIQSISLLVGFLYQQASAFHLNHVQPTPSLELSDSTLHSPQKAARSKVHSRLDKTLRETVEKNLDNDIEITNDSDDTRGSLKVWALNITLTPPVQDLTTEQTSLVLSKMEEFLLAEFETYTDELKLIKYLNLNDDVETKYVAARRLLRNGRYLGESGAHSEINISGGIANYTWDVDFGENYPTEDKLNDAVLSILNTNIANILSDAGLVGLTEVEVEQYIPGDLAIIVTYPEGDIFDDTEKVENPKGFSYGALFGILAAIVVALGFSYHSWKKEKFKNIGAKYRQVRSNLRMKSIKRDNSQGTDGEYLVEVCTDTVEKLEPPSSPVSASKHSYHSARSMPSPSSVRGQKQKAEEAKTIDPSEYVIEIGTDEIGE